MLLNCSGISVYGAQKALQALLHVPVSATACDRLVIRLYVCIPGGSLMPGQHNSEDYHLQTAQVHMHEYCLQAGGSRGLEELLADQAEEAKPEFLRKRPKYFYYYQWMRERLDACCGELPAPVVDKLLLLDATELDMLLTHPKGIQQQVRPAGQRQRQLVLAACHGVLTWSKTCTAVRRA